MKIDRYIVLKKMRCNAHRHTMNTLALRNILRPCYSSTTAPPSPRLSKCILYTSLSLFLSSFFPSTKWNLFNIYYLRNTRINFSRFHLPISFTSSHFITATPQETCGRSYSRCYSSPLFHLPSQTCFETELNNIYFRFVFIFILFSFFFLSWSNFLAGMGLLQLISSTDITYFCVTWDKGMEYALVNKVCMSSYVCVCVYAGERAKEKKRKCIIPDWNVPQKSDGNWIWYIRMGRN